MDQVGAGAIGATPTRLSAEQAGSVLRAQLRGA